MSSSRKTLNRNSIQHCWNEKRKLLGKGKNEQPSLNGDQPPHTSKKADPPYFDALTLSVLCQRKAQY